MKFSITAALLLAVSPFAAASNCRTGLNYCTGSLLGRGDYQAQLDQGAFDHNQAWTQYNYAPGGGVNLIWACRGGRSGVIQFLQDCGSAGCVDGGSGNNDYCRNSAAEASDEYFEGPAVETHHWTQKMRFQREH